MSELIELLEEQDPDAEVFVMSQPNWPFELGISGVTVREEMVRADAEADGDVAGVRYEPGTAPNDVFIVEGEQLRYGSKTAWQVAVR